jgi:hypothetical protein
MTWYLRAVELEDGRWACRHGRNEYDLHADLDSAISHLHDLARDLGDAEVFVHPLESPIALAAIIES